MLVTPKTEEQFAAEEQERLEKYKPWPKGTICDYEIIDAKDGISSKGNEMIVAEVRVFNSEGKAKEITDYIGEWNEFKLKRINPERYEAGQVDAMDLIGKTGKCKLGIQIGGLKDDGTRYSDKNTIQEFLKADEQLQTSIKASSKELNDEIPF